MLILIAETESHIRGLDEVAQCRLSIRMVAGFAEITEMEEFFGCGEPDTYRSQDRKQVNLGRTSFI